MKQLTKKQINANQKNSLLGGVKTEQGKLISSKNSLKHGLLSELVVMEDENRELFSDFSDRVLRSLKPIGEMEKLFTDRIIVNAWRLRRCVKVETNRMEYAKNNVRVDLNSAKEQEQRGRLADMIRDEAIDRILRYETTVERGLFRALHELQRLQAKRSGKSENLPIAVDVDVSNGFVSQNADFADR